VTSEGNHKICRGQDNIASLCDKSTPITSRFTPRLTLFAIRFAHRSNELAARVQREQEEERENIKSMVLKGDVVLGDRSEGSGEGLGGVGEQAKKRRVSITASKKY